MRAASSNMSFTLTFILEASKCQAEYHEKCRQKPEISYYVGLRIKKHVEIAPYRHVNRAESHGRHHGLGKEHQAGYDEIRNEQAFYLLRDESVFSQCGHVGELPALTVVAVSE